jgi:hypothetical protein
MERDDLALYRARHFRLWARAVFRHPAAARTAAALSPLGLARLRRLAVFV